jgi:hypothetical protein
MKEGPGINQKHQINYLFNRIKPRLRKIQLVTYE